MVRMNGRPTENRIHKSDPSATANNAINQASGRFNHTNADQLTSANNATMANRTSFSVSRASFGGSHLFRR